MNEVERIEKIASHIDNVRKNGLIIAKKLIELGQVELGRHLVAEVHRHDVSKFFATEWTNLDHYVSEDKVDKDKLSLAVQQHNTSNPHHPEYWDGIANMPRVYLAEMVCDWAARASEFGTSLHDWITGGAMKRYSFKKNSKVYKDIMFFVNLLVDKPFKQT